MSAPHIKQKSMTQAPEPMQTESTPMEEIPQHEVDHAEKTLHEAHTIMQKPHMVKAVHHQIKNKMKAIKAMGGKHVESDKEEAGEVKTIKDIRNKANKLASDEDGTSGT